jgi:hypothetical protein
MIDAFFSIESETAKLPIDGPGQWASVATARNALFAVLY